MTKPENHGRRHAFAWLWTFILFNYVYGDIIMMFTLLSRSTLFAQLQRGTVGGIHLDSSFMLWGSVAMESCIAMILVSAFAPRNWNWPLQLLGGAINAAMQVALIAAGGATMAVGSARFFQLVELGAAVTVIALAWRWRVSTAEERN